MRSRSIIRLLSAFILFAMITFVASSAYYYANPASAITGIWESISYFDTFDGEHTIRSRIDIDGRSIIFSTLIYDNKNHLAAKREVKMHMKRKARLSRTNVFDLEVNYVVPFSSFTDPAIERQTYVFSKIQLRLYLLDCNQFIMDSNVHPQNTNATIFNRSMPITCDL